jgi:predicted XRE-type DNA-binding protein
LSRRKLTQARSAKLLNVTQPRISDLMRGRFDLFSLDTLVDMAQLAGLQTKMTVKARRAA